MGRHQELLAGYDDVFITVVGAIFVPWNERYERERGRNIGRDTVAAAATRIRKIAFQAFARIY